jgi:hypothetical protein
MEGDEEVLAFGVELGVQRSRVRLDREAGSLGELFAGGVGEGVIGGGQELGAGGRVAIGE